MRLAVHTQAGRKSANSRLCQDCFSFVYLTITKKWSVCEDGPLLSPKYKSYTPLMPTFLLVFIMELLLNNEAQL